MGEFIDKTKGAGNKALGKAKVAVGRRIDKPELIASGAKLQIKGKAQTISGKIKGAMGNKI